MDTYHGFDYTRDAFDKDEALKFVLAHYAFRDITDFGEDRQHVYISRASTLVDHLKQSYDLRQDYEDFKESIPIITVSSLMILLAGIIACGAIIYISIGANFSGYGLRDWLVLSVLMSVFIGLPLNRLAGSPSGCFEATEGRLQAIHNIELKISSQLTLAAQDNLADVYRSQLELEDQTQGDLSPINIH